MATKNKKIEETNELNSLPPEFLKEVYKENQDFVENVFNYDLNEELDNFSEPLTLREKKSLKNYELENVDAEEDFDGLIMDLAKLRGFDDELVDNQAYSELSIWVRKVCYGTFNLRRAAKK